MLLKAVRDRLGVEAGGSCPFELSLVNITITVANCGHDLTIRDTHQFDKRDGLGANLAEHRSEGFVDHGTMARLKVARILALRH